MMIIKKLFTVLLFICSLTMYGQDTVEIKTFTFADDFRDAVFDFPTEDHNNWSKIIMEYGMRCHDLAVGNGSVGCREWDYSCNTMLWDSTQVDSVLRDDGNGNFIYEKSGPRRYEIMSFVTPYGNGLDLGPEGKTWTFDVTDFGPVLKGSKRINFTAGGEYQEEMAITFKFIRGTPTRNVLKIDQIWPVSFGTNPGRIDRDETFEPRNYSLPNNTDAAKVRSVVTGHRQNGEFAPYQHWMDITSANDVANHRYVVWKECSTVPVYPQGGTWILDRAGWCPGDPSQVHEWMLSPAMITDGAVELDYNIRDAWGLTDAVYIINNQIISYGPPNFSLDGSIEVIKQPSDQVEYARYNPSCTSPIIGVRNRGTEPITSLEIEYYTDPANKSSFTWTGNLEFMEEADIELPVVVQDLGTPSEKVTFAVTLAAINGQQDDNTVNNTMKTRFTRAKHYYGETMQVLFTTNKAPKDNEFRIIDQDSNIVLELTDLASGKGYFEELTIGPGCYRMEVTDKNDDGLYYWAYEQNGPLFGKGAIQLYLDLTEIEDFEPEFGRFLRYEFVLNGPVSTNTGLLSHIKVFPNPAETAVIISKKGKSTSDHLIQIMSVDGRVVKSKQVQFGTGEVRTVIDISDLSPGAYILTMSSEKGLQQTPLIIK